MLSRTEAVERLIMLRRSLFPSDSCFPSDTGDTAEFDQFIIDIIGPTEEKSSRITEIINLALYRQITPRTAAVAIQELASNKTSYKTGRKNKKNTKPGKKGRNGQENSGGSPAKKEKRKSPGVENLEELKKRGWNRRV
ncbi:hypothetical protein [Halarsenatibacter silvermanii]|uniref:Uncharacterized protein n=1 Tax=Halarsenatibacter silvermanii TaxID=321763 RepID=A0A1G9RP23_9FIRM|nr:hypothetical protein [Halarsenatibacter silvermanii]SDM25048.1 hypothetical protein SAMN04488692_12315 [Halarsenatibacter silvermanii]